MMRGMIILLTLTMATATATSCVADEPLVPDAQDAAFDKLKAMAGDWDLTGPEGQLYGTAHVEVTASGNAIIEKAFVGKPFEMVTVYTRDGRQLAASHFCWAGNQPYLVAKSVQTAGRIEFDFVSVVQGSHSPPGAYLHDIDISFLEDGRVRQERQFYKDQAPEKLISMTFKRKG